MAGITQPKPGEHVNANGVWDLSQNKGKMTVFSLCLLLCADLLDLAVGKSDPRHMIFHADGATPIHGGLTTSKCVSDFWGVVAGGSCV